MPYVPVSHFNRQRNASEMVLLNADFFHKLYKWQNGSRFCNDLSYCLRIDGRGKVKKQKTK